VYRAYSARMSFFLQKIFTCEYTGKSGLDYFQALDSEFEESKKTQLKFPDALKPKVLRACQFRTSFIPVLTQSQLTLDICRGGRAP
jgi:hypothetical protein